jgi:hypothetical protein
MNGVRRIPMNEKTIEKWLIGAALTAAAPTLLPIVKNILRPLATTELYGSGDWIDRVKTTTQFIREEFEDIVAEAQFERMKKQLDLEMNKEDE